MSATTNENRITTPQALHNSDGTLAVAGYATSALLEYDRARIKAAKWRIKEWDYYLINDDNYAVALTIGDLGYMGLISASVIDFGRASGDDRLRSESAEGSTPNYKTTSVLAPFPMGGFHMPASSKQGVAHYENSKVRFHFEVEDGKRRLSASFARFDGSDDLHFEVVLDEEPRDSMVIATPWAEDPKAFYYNQKIVGMRAQGRFTKGSFEHRFEPSNSLGLLDWGRGVWTRDNTWFWGVAQGWQTGKRDDGEVGGAQTPGNAQSPSASQASHLFALNLGYGFGDTSAASENMIFLDGIAHKLERVVFDIPQKSDASAKPKRLVDRYDLLEPWHVYDEKGKLDLNFQPFLDRADLTDIALVISDQHQMFGLLSGKVLLDGKEFYVKDLISAIEVVRNKY